MQKSKNHASKGKEIQLNLKHEITTAKKLTDEQVNKNLNKTILLFTNSPKNAL